MTRGLTATTIKTYTDVLKIFSAFMENKKNRANPKEVKISDVFDYLQYLKAERGNGQNSLQKNSAIIKKFYEGLVALGLVEYYHNPVKDFKRVKGGEERVRDVLNRKEAKRLLMSPNEGTVLGIRDKAIILLLYSTGIRASECVGLKIKDVDLEGNQINVMGKGQKERIIPLNQEVVKYLKKYLKVRGEGAKLSSFFITRNRKGITRKGIYDRIKKYVREARIGKIISPHNLRHTFATEMIERKISLVTIQNLLGHRSISSTMRYLRINLKDIRDAIDRHPINEFSDILDRLLPDVRLPYQLSRSGFK
jgi:site-specific recombinase XerD